MAGEKFLVLPWSGDAPEVELHFGGLASGPIVRRFRLAQGRVDSWRYIPLGSTDTPEVRSDQGPVAAARIVNIAPLLRGTVFGVVLPFGETIALRESTRRDGVTHLELACDLLGAGDRADIIRLSSVDRIEWHLEGVDFDACSSNSATSQVLPSGATPDGTAVCLLGDPLASPPVDSLQIWQRPLADAAEGSIEIPLRFRVVPGTWPEISIENADYTNADVTAPAHEVRLACESGEGESAVLSVAGFQVAVNGRVVTAGEVEHVVTGDEPIDLALYLQGAHMAVVVNGKALTLLAATPSEDGLAASPITSNISDFRISSRDPSVGTLRLSPDVKLLRSMVFGLREPRSSMYRTAVADHDGPGEVFYQSEHFTVYDRRVEDLSDLGPAAIVPGRSAIVSPIRVVEEFVWRDTPFGDMTRVADRQELWRSALEPGRFPVLTTSFTSVNAAFDLALETFQRNSSNEFTLPGESGLWSAGYFQGPGLGFGSWKRDTSHIALRSGNLLDPQVARASLAHVVNSGFDNGSDGDSLPAVAVWDYFLATGDESLIQEVWGRLVDAGSALDARFDADRGLIAAPQSTSNDCFDEPEVDGFALSTEVYSMQTYAALSQMAALPTIRDDRAEQWAERSAIIRRTIINQYWNPEHGIFTSGPKGSEAFARGYWETSGAEAALWGFLGQDAEPMTKLILERMQKVAMSEYGVVLFPYKDLDNHFCGSVWYCWQAGIARAAARVGDSALVHQMVGQQVRTVVRNKTFYEVTDAATGDSWRWPGQLWHAAGFVSLVLYGLLGIRYDLDGMTFTPAVAPEFEGTRFEGLRYREALLDVEIRGHGSCCDMSLDGRPVDRIPLGLVGGHTVVLTMRQKIDGGER